MAETSYRCAVNGSHPIKKMASEFVMAPSCCGKPMVKIQVAPAQSPAPGAAKPQNPPQAKPAQAKPKI